jgi:hypothetical protein
VTGRWFSPVSSTNKTDRHDIPEILLTVTLNIITITLNEKICPCNEKFNMLSKMAAKLREQSRENCVQLITL